MSSCDLLLEYGLGRQIGRGFRTVLPFVVVRSISDGVESGIELQGMVGWSSEGVDLVYRLFHFPAAYARIANLAPDSQPSSIRLSASPIEWTVLLLTRLLE